MPYDCCLCSYYWLIDNAEQYSHLFSEKCFWIQKKRRIYELKILLCHAVTEQFKKRDSLKSSLFHRIVEIGRGPLHIV